jgi:dipeptidyl aminopeptidase/acylaminoacyl peptidase
MLLPTLALFAGFLLRGPLQAQQKVLNLEDYAQWKRVTSTSLSGDGQWVSFAYAPNDGETTLFLRDLDGMREDTITRGAGATFSEDGVWVLYSVTPPEGRGGRGQGGRGQQPPQQPQGRGGRGGRGGGPRTQFLKNLDTGAMFEVPGVGNASFSPDGGFALFKRSGAQGAEHDGTDLLIRTLATGATRNIGNVQDYSFNEGGALLAYTVDAADNVGNGVYVMHMESGLTTPLHTSKHEYAQLTWNEAGTAVAVLHGETPETSALRSNVLAVYTGLGARTPAREITLDPASAQGFPAGMVISEFNGLDWSANGQRVFFGIKEQEPAPPDSSGQRANVDVWHWADDTPQSVQMQRINQLRRATQPAVFHLDGNRFVRLGDEAMTNVSSTADGDGRWAIGRNDEAYRGEVAWGGSRADYHRVDVTTGERAPMLEALGRTYGTSPDGRWFVYLKEGKLYARELETGRTQNLSDIAGVDFLDHRDDHPYEIPIYGSAGWTRDGKSVLLYDDFDLWAVPVEGGRPVNVTRGVGNAEQIRFRITNTFDQDDDEQDEPGVDLTKTIYLSATGEWTKMTGYYELKPGGTPTPIVWEDLTIGGVSKAENADRIIYTKQTFVDFPDYYVADTRFQNQRKITNANPQQAEYAWGRRILVDYENSKGQKLQATLALPANYQPGQRYPMLVYFYEIMSNQHHRYSMPSYDDRPHMSTYASNGYLVLQPDVVYETGRPGSSAVDCVTAAVKKVIELGYADPERIGLQGHSWGGYQSSYIVTQTDLFAAVVTGAPVTNLVSFYNELYKSSGNVQQGITERGQVRMGTTPFENFDLYVSQSPVHQAMNITTPFLILHGTDDGSVDWHQGLEYFNMARRMGKKVILLSYPDEGHHLGRRENQKDFQVRMKQFFDHYLKDAPAPQWITEGVPQLQKGRETDVVVTTNGGGR